MRTIKDDEGGQRKFEIVARKKKKSKARISRILSAVSQNTYNENLKVITKNMVRQQNTLILMKRKMNEIESLLKAKMAQNAEAKEPSKKRGVRKGGKKNLRKRRRRKGRRRRVK